MKICIRTASIRKSNDEVVMETNGHSYNVGVIEYEEDWHPFKISSDECNSEFEGSDVEEDGISDTWQTEDYDTDDIEDGEYIPEHQGRIEQVEVEEQ